MKCFAPSFVLTFATLLAASAVDALSIQSSDITTSPIGGHQTLEKTWTVTSAKQLQDLLVQIPGNVFVDYDASLKSSSASDVVAKIVVSGDSEDLINVFDVVPRESSHNVVSEDSLKVHLTNKDATVKGYVLTQIFVADQSVLRELSAVSSHDVVLGENVLVHDDASASVKLSTVGSGGLFFTSKEKFTVKSLKISSAGTGNVQFQVASLEASKGVELSLAGTGNIAVVAGKFQADKLESQSAGTGNLFVQAESLKVQDLTTNVAGSGKVTLSKSGTCATQEISIAGTGSVASGSIICQDTEVSLVGTGDAVVQSRNSLKVSTVFAGSIKYVNARPKQVKESSFYLRHRESVSAAAKNTFQTYKTVEIPARSPLLLDLKIQERLFLENPDLRILSDNKIFDFASTANFGALAPTTSSTNGAWSIVPVVGVAGVALAAVGALVRKFHQQQKREEYSPLV